MVLPKKTKSLPNVTEVVIEKSDNEFHSAPTKLETEHDVPLDDQDDDKTQTLRTRNKTKKKTVQYATDGQKQDSKGWPKLQDGRTQNDDDDKYKSRSDIFSWDCGEPQDDQFLTIDFSPEKGVDDDNFVLDKCINFWKFIENHPELQSLRAQPEFDEVSILSQASAPISSTESSTDVDVTSSPSSCSILASTWLMKEDLMSSCLATKTEETCMPELQKYADYQIEKPIKHVTRKKLPALYASTSYMNVTASNLSIKRGQLTTFLSMDDLGKMMAEMRTFDSKHRGSLDPPEHPPSLIHAQMIRNESVLPFIKTGRS